MTIYGEDAECRCGRWRQPWFILSAVSATRAKPMHRSALPARRRLLTSPTLLALLALTCAATGALAQAQDQAVLDAIKQCSQLADATERYACFDRATAAAGLRPGGAAPAAGAPAQSPRAPGAATTQSRIPASPPRPAEPAAAPAAPPAPAPATAEGSRPGAPFDPPAVEARRQATDNAEANSFRDRIVDLREREPGKWLITLESGQQWYQVESKRYALGKGMDVRIYPGLFGSSWRLSADELKGFVQVQRVK